MSTKKIKIFISCPGDAEREARRAIRICEKLSAKYIENYNVKIDSIYWKDVNIFPRRITGERTQVSINQPLEDQNYDIYFGILWTKFGKTDKTSSYTPTEEEFEIALDNYKKYKSPYVYLLFKTTKFYPSSAYDSEQLLRVIEFKESISSRNIGLYNEFSTKKEFDFFLETAIEEYIEDNLRKTNKSETEKDINPKVTISLSQISYLMNRSVYTRDEMASNSFLFSSAGIDLKSLLKDKRRIVVLGDAGAGKSVELKKLYREFEGEDTFYYSFYIELNKYIAGDMAEMLPANWKDVPEEQRLFIFDGLDEVESVHQNEVRKSIETIAETSESSRIVVSCRKNFYDIEIDDISGTLKDFDEYILYDLSSEEYCLFIEKALGKEGKGKFLEGVYEHELNDYLKVPFYLVNLVEVFKDNLTFPKSKLDILKSFVDLRLKLDIEHFRTTIDLRGQKDNIITNLKKLALAMEIIGKNNIISREVSRYVDNRDIRELLIHGTLISLNDTGTNKETWQFEHNNFQEYMAAQALSNLDLDKILDFVYDERSNQIIPHWSNTVNFLVSIRDKRDFREWVIEKEPEMLVKSERGKLAKEQRIEIFKNIFNKYKEKKIWIDDSHFRSKDLALFGQYDEIVEFLLSQDSPQTPHTALIEAIGFLGEMEIPDKYKPDAIKMLMDKSQDFARGEYVQYKALVSLSYKPNLLNEYMTEELVLKLKNADSQYVRMGVYVFLNNSPFYDKYIQVYLDGIIFLNKNFNSKKTSLVNEPILLKEGLSKAKGNTLIRVIDFICANQHDFRQTLAYDEKLLTALLKNAVESYKEDKNIFASVLKLLTTMDGSHSETVSFFKATNTTKKAVDIILGQKHSYNTILWIAILADNNTIKNICSNYPSKIYNDSFIESFIVTLRNCNDKDIYQDFYEKINKISGNKFISINKNNLAEIRKIKKQKDFDLLFDKKMFLKEIEDIFKFKNTKEITYDNCVDLTYREKNNFSPNVINKLERLALKKANGRNSKITLKEAILYFEKLDWTLFSMWEIYECLKHDDEILQIPQEKRDYIETIYNDYLGNIDFKKSLKSNNNNQSYNPQAKMLIYFLRKFKLKTTKKVLYDMLFFDYPGTSTPWEGIDYLSEFLTQVDLKKQIIKNLTTENLNQIAFKNHIDYCIKHNLNTVVDIAQENLLENSLYEPARESCLEYICSFANDWIKILEEAVRKITGSFKWDIVDKLIPIKSTSCNKYLEEIMQKPADKKEQYKAIEKALEMNNIEALKCFTKIIESCEQIPVEILHGRYMLNIDSLDALPYYMTLLKFYYLANSEDHYYLSFGNNIKNALEILGTKDEKSFRAATEALRNFMEAHKGLKNINFLNYDIDKIEKQYYMENSPKLTCDQVKNRIDKIFA